MSAKKELELILGRALRVQGQTLKKDENGNLMPLANGRGYQMVDADKAIRDFMTELSSVEPDPVEQAKMVTDAWEAAIRKDYGPQTELSALRMEQYTNFMIAESTFMTMYYEQVSLGPSEEPGYTNETPQEIRILPMGEDGEPEEVKVVLPQRRVLIGLRLLISEKVRYKILDLYKGQIGDIARKQFDIPRDLNIHLDRELFTLLNEPLENGGCFGPFAYENSRANKAARIYVPHSVIKTEHLPETNFWQLWRNAGAQITQDGIAGVTVNPTQDQTDAFEPAVLKAIVHYSNLWDRYLPGNAGRLVPTGEIVVPSKDIISIADLLAPVSNTTSNSLQEQVTKSGYMSLDYLGYTWKFIPDVTIDPGTCYPRFSSLPGQVFFKPSMDKEVVKMYEDLNEEERYAIKCYGAHILSQRRPRAMKIEYIDPN